MHEILPDPSGRRRKNGAGGRRQNGFRLRLRRDSDQDMTGVGIDIRHRRYRRFRAGVLEREPLCRLCAASGMTVAASELDHIVPRSKGGALMDHANVQPLCAECHARKSADERRRPRSRFCERHGYPRAECVVCNPNRLAAAENRPPDERPRLPSLRELRNGIA